MKYKWKPTLTKVPSIEIQGGITSSWQQEGHDQLLMFSLKDPQTIFMKINSREAINH